LLYRWLKRVEGRKLVFVPTINKAKMIAKLLRIPYVSASSQDLSEKIDLFAKTKNASLITTTVLERGVTFINAQVCVLEADHKVFSPSSLIQIAGRVGRSPDYPSGEVLFLCSKHSRNLRACSKTLIHANNAV
jgi:competence protein ComFA